MNAKTPQQLLEGLERMQKVGTDALKKGVDRAVVDAAAVARRRGAPGTFRVHQDAHGVSVAHTGRQDVLERAVRRQQPTIDRAYHEEIRRAMG